MRTKDEVKILCRRVSELEGAVTHLKGRLTEEMMNRDMDHVAMTGQGDRIGSLFQIVAELQRREVLSVEILGYYESRIEALEKAAGIKRIPIRGNE